MYHRLDSQSSTNGDGSKRETIEFTSTPTSNSYGSTPVHDQLVARFYVPSCGLVFYIMAFFGFCCALLVRECLSVAIVVMVNQTDDVGDSISVTNLSDYKCPRDPELRYDGGEFNWDRHQQGVLLAAFYYGYGVLQVPGGLVADRFGGKWLYGGSVLLSSVVALMTPAAARVHIGVLIALRVLSGLGEGVMLPAVHALIARWSAPKYRSVVVSAIFVGTDAGVILGTFLSGVLCDYGFAGGWPSVFYVFGVVGCVWSGAWFLLCYDSPSTHPRITTEERSYWERTIGAADLVAHPPTPWRKIFTSIPVWALAAAFLANNWGYFTMATCLPLYMHDVLGVDMTSNGAFSALPFVASIVMVPINGLFVDWLRSMFTTDVVRKLFCAVGFILTGCFLVLTGYVGCDRTLAVATMFTVMACSALGFPSVAVNQLDLAPLHAGKIMGLTFTVANLGAIAAPHAVGVLTYERSTRSEWRKVFFLTAGIYVLGAAIFVVFGSGERQSWADDNDHDKLRR